MYVQKFATVQIVYCVFQHVEETIEDTAAEAPLL